MFLKLKLYLERGHIQHFFAIPCVCMTKEGLHLAGPIQLVLGDVEEGFAVVSPGHISSRVLQNIHAFSMTSRSLPVTNPSPTA